MPKEVANKKKQPVDNNSDSEEEQQVVGKKVKGAAGKAAAPKEDLKLNNKLKNKGKAAKKQDSDDESSDEEPKSKPAAKKGKAQESSDDESDEAPKGKKAVAPAKNGKGKKAESDDDDEEEVKPKAAASKSNGASAGTGGEVFVRGLPFSATEDEVRDHFAGCGDIQGINLLKGHDGRSKGIAFVKFDTDSEISAAVALNDSDLGGRQIFVEKSIPREKREGQQGGQQGGARQFGDGPKTAQDPSSTTIFVGNLSYDSNEDTIREHFEECGAIASVRVARDQDGRMRGFGHVDFESADSCKTAVGKAGSFLDGRAINVDFAGGKKGGSGGGFGGGRGGRGGFGGGRGGRGGFGGGRGGRGGRF